MLSEGLWLLPLLSMLLRTTGQAAQFVPQKGSKVTIEGISNLHDWRVEGMVINGLVQFTDDFSHNTPPKLELGKIQAEMEGSVPTRSLHSVTDGKAFDEFICTQLKGRLNPSTLFRFSELVLKTPPASKDSPYVFDSRCQLVVAGVTNQTSMSLQVIPLSGNKLKITGSTSINLTDFDIPPIRLPTERSSINVGDTVKVSFEWLVGLKSKN
jgi:hypothetical protein